MEYNYLALSYTGYYICFAPFDFDARMAHTILDDSEVIFCDRIDFLSFENASDV